MPPTRISAERLERRTGLAEVRVFARLGSTNSRAALLVKRGELELPAAIVASRQTAGRGRGQNTWWSDAGTLTATFVLPTQRGRQPQELPLRAGLAVFRAVSGHVPAERLRIKWPNDLLAGGKKLAGLLCERVGAADLIGVGLNVGTDLEAAPAEVRRRATSIAALTGAAPPVEDVLVDLVVALRAAWDAADWCAEVNRVHAMTGQDVVIDTGDGTVRGRCIGIDAEGRLVVDDGTRQHHIASGQVVG